MFGSNMREYVESVGQLPEPSPAVNSHALVSAAAAVQSNTDKIFTDISMAFDEHLDQVSGPLSCRDWPVCPLLVGAGGRSGSRPCPQVTG